MMPSLSDLAALAEPARPYLIGAVVTVCALLTVVLLARAIRPAARPGALENKLTLLVAVIIAGICAQGMGRFFLDQLRFPVELVVVVGGVLELTAFTCALRARRNIREAKTPDQARAGIDGVAVWVIAAMSGVFSALDSTTGEESLFRLLMPLLAAWLWERGMSIERRAAGQSTVHWRVTPERLLVWLRLAEPTGRTASEVDAHRRLTKVARAAYRVSFLTDTSARPWRVDWAQRRLQRATQAAVTHASLSTDRVRQKTLLAHLGSLKNAAALADIQVPAPWQVTAKAVDTSDNLAHPEWDDETPAGMELWDTLPTAPGNVSENTKNASPWGAVSVSERWPLPWLANVEMAPTPAAASVSRNDSENVSEAFPTQVNGHPQAGYDHGPDDVEEIDAETLKNARETFSDEIAEGAQIPVRAIMRRCRVGYAKAARIKAVLDPENT